MGESGSSARPHQRGQLRRLHPPKIHTAYLAPRAACCLACNLSNLSRILASPLDDADGGRELFALVEVGNREVGLGNPEVRPDAAVAEGAGLGTLLSAVLPVRAGALAGVDKALDLPMVVDVVGRGKPVELSLTAASPPKVLVDAILDRI